MSLPIKLAEEVILEKDDFDMTMSLINGIEHKNCRTTAMSHYWKPCWDDVRKIAIIRPNNIFWLYFWAETGQGSEKATRQSREVFYKIFGSEKPYGKSKPDYETFFELFDSALESTGLPFRVRDGKNGKNNTVRDALRPINCTNHCLEIFRQVMDKMEAAK